MDIDGTDRPVGTSRRPLDAVRRMLDDEASSASFLDAFILSAIFIVVVGIGYLAYEGLARFAYLF